MKSRSALYRAENIRDQFFVWIFFIFNGHFDDNGRRGTTGLYWVPMSIGPRYNGVRITALQCFLFIVYTFNKQMINK